MPTTAEVLKNNDFWGLPIEERRKVLAKINPDFSSLPSSEQTKVIARRRDSGGLSAPPKKETDPEKLFTPEQRANLAKTEGYIQRNTPEEKGVLGQAGEFFSTLGKDVAGAGKAAFKVAYPFTDPKGAADIIRGIFGAQAEQFQKVPGDVRAGYYSEAAGHLAAGALPLVGPAAAQAGEELGAGQYGAGGAHALELLGPSAAGKVIPERVGGRVLSNVNNPTEEAALKSVEPNVRMSVGQRTGRAGVQRAEQALVNFPGSAGRAQKFYAGQEADLAREAQRRIAANGGQQTNAVGAGEAIQQRRGQRVTRLKSQADKLYGEVRKAAEANKQTVQTGTKQSSILGPGGQPLTTPVYSTLETPVDLAPIRSQLEPIYDELKRSLPDARRANSPAWKSLEDLMTSKDTHMNAMDFDRTLSALKSITRDGKSSMLSSQSQGLAKQIIKSGESEFQKALRGAGPDVNQKLRTARNIVRSYYDTDELLSSLNSEPAALYHHLVTGGDRVYNTLSALQKVAPKEMKTVGRTFLDGLVDKATKEGGFQRSAGVKADWERLGPETKELLFGKQLTGEMDKFMLAAKRLTSPLNPSGSAHMIAALGGLGVAGEIVRSLLTGNPTEAAAVGLSGVAVPNIAARVMFTPGGLNLMTRVITLPTGSAAWGKAAVALNGFAHEAEAETRKQTPPTQ
jgi:hypothetical protein